MTQEKTYDYIVVGGGTSGTILANRLSKNPNQSVLLIESGRAPKNFWINMPAGVSRLIFPGRYNWGFNTEAEPHLLGRSIYAPRGRGVGGSSLINGMAYFQGQPEDFDAWHAQGCTGWDWTHIQQLYRKVLAVDPEGGGLYVAAPSYVHPSSHDFIASAHQLGVPLNADFNASTTDGAGVIPFSIKQGVRHSGHRAFIAPVRNRSNLEVMTNAQVERIVLEGTRAVGVELVRDGVKRTVRSRKEVVVCAGAFGSPQLLLKSGIGDADYLQAQGIAVAAHLPGVGQNLQDHMYIHHTYACTPASSLNAEFRGLSAIWHGMNYVFRKQGPLTSGASQAVAFVRSSDAVDRPDLQICYRPVSWVFDQNGTMQIGKTPEMTVSVCNLRPTSRGQVLLGKNGGGKDIQIFANYLATENDQDIAVRAVKQTRAIFKVGPVAQRVKQEMTPGQAVQSDADILDYIRSSAQSMHHWAGTCKMGVDAQAVVDPQLRVYGIQGLRVADASIIPNIVSANTNAVSYVIGEKAAEMILSTS